MTSLDHTAAVLNFPASTTDFGNFECRLIDSSLIRKYSLFVFEVLKSNVARTPRLPKTLHYRGEGKFMLSGPTIAPYRRGFKPENL